MNWKKEFDFKQERVWQLPDKTAVDRQTLEFIKAFISTEIIERLIEDIPGGVLANNHTLGRTNMMDIKQQLRDKWL